MVIWGTKRKKKVLGTAADFCPICREIQAFEISRMQMVKHVYYIPLGAGKIVGHLAACKNCSVNLYVDAQRYQSIVEKDSINIHDLIRITNPELREELAARLVLEEKLKQKEQISPEERRFLINDPFSVISPMLDLRYGDSLPLDKVTGRSCLLTIIIPLMVLFFSLLFRGSVFGDIIKFVGYTLGVIGILVTIVNIFTTQSRYLDQLIYPLFAKALEPLDPSKDEIETVLKKFKDLKLIVGRKIKSQKILDAINCRLPDTG